MASRPTRTLETTRRDVELPRPDKVLFPGDGPGDGWTKQDLAEYYRAVAPFLLPRLRDRPLMLERCPDGIAGQRFMQKNTPDHYPAWIARRTLSKEGGTVTHTLCQDTPTLLYLAGQACVTLHRWQSRAARPDHPDHLVFDLDPPEHDFAPVRDAARLVRDFLDRLGLPAVAMTTGSRGVHVLTPLDGHADFDTVRDFARAAADALAAAHPDRLTTAVRRNERGGRLYLDIQRNGYAQTAVAPYTVRAKPGAAVAAPLTWEQLDDPRVDSRTWTMENAVEQARTKPWSGAATRGRSLGPARRRLEKLG
ncbi:non-homologous end-joining DNA ligase [Streptomyces sp. NPDC050560]|uniref:non-homologous end-joining DNA ligase n=1 Tax=Streptomyces sp. NPDC050560 TaxID=3365630 RepID=UPI00379C2E6D